MRSPRARFTIRRMVVGVIVTGVILGALVLLGRGLRWYGYCKMRADKHREAQIYMEMMAHDHQPRYGFYSPYLSDKYKRLADYHAQMRRKWEAAAWRPGELVAPDPPDPE
jgi:hypothetical protein